ncbi:MAG: 5-formyltetrahydrofolate cyclo-ligase [Methanocellales archaeon]
MINDKDQIKNKEQIRNRIWSLMESSGIADFPLPVSGRIPNFKGALQASQRLRETEIWKKSKVVFSSPDYAQKYCREFALKDGKTLLMATPRLKEGYLILKPEDVKGREKFASTIKGAFKYGKNAVKLPKVDLVITGSVAVDIKGNRIGKGGGYGDREITQLKQEGCIDENTPIVTTVHDIQIIEDISELVEEHDVKITHIVTPTRILKCL